MESQISRTASLNNIPKAKLLTRLNTLFESCEICSKKEIKVNQSLENGICTKCRLTTIAFNRYYDSNIPVEYWDLKMEKDFSGYPDLLNKYNETVSDLKTTYINGDSICFAGGHGRGKSMAVSCILKKAANKGYNCLYTTLSDIVNVLMQASTEEKFSARRELMMVDFLVIDEFDSRFIPSENAADLYARTLESIFRTRSQNKIPTFLCTNSPNIIETFTGPLKQSIDSLMKGYLKTFVVLGEDFRKKNK